MLLVFLVMDFNARLEELERLSKKATAVRSQATQVMQTQTALQTAIAVATSDQAVEGAARNRGEIRPGAQPVVPLPEPGSPLFDLSTPTPAPTPMQNWQVWWELFFGE